MLCHQWNRTESLQKDLSPVCSLHARHIFVSYPLAIGVDTLTPFFSTTERNWCRRRDSNPHALTSATPSRWCVCQISPLRHKRSLLAPQRSLLARIMHKLSTAVLQSSTLTALCFLGLLGVLHEYACGALRCTPCHRGAYSTSSRRLHLSEVKENLCIIRAHSLRDCLPGSNRPETRKLLLRPAAVQGLPVRAVLRESRRVVLPQAGEGCPGPFQSCCGYT